MPANDYLHIKTNLPIGESMLVSIYDLAGRNVFSKKSNVNDVQVDISSFLSGIYILQMEGGDITLARKIIVQH